MSASREKKKRQEFLANGGVDAKAVQAAQQKAAEKRSAILYTTLAIVFVAAAIFLLVFNSGILQRSRAALTIDGEKYTAADVSYYYNNAYQNFLNSDNGYLIMQLGMLDPQQPLGTQKAFGSEDQTWADYFKDQAVNSMKLVHAAVSAAKAENMQLDDEDMELFNESIAAVEKQAEENDYSYKSYLSLVYGGLMTPDVYEENVKDTILAGKYINAHQDSLSFTDEEIQAYYEENKNTYDLVDGGYVTIYGTPETKKDDEGNTIEATDEEKAAAMDAAREKAEKILADYEAKGDLNAAAEANEATYTGGEELTYTSGTAVDWLFDAERKAGDAEILVDEEGSRVYVAAFNGRERNEYPAYDVRHILVTDANLELGEDEEAEDGQVLAKAEEILASWDGTEEGFAKLAEEHSQDGGSKLNGGLYEDAYWGQMVTQFNDWCYETGRKAGDTDIVNTQFGEHIMYFVGYGEEQFWHFACNNKLIGNAMTEWQAELTEGLTAEVQSGMKSVG